MSDRRLRIVILGLSITSSWGNGHATTYRGLVRELGRRGHAVLFLERDVPWYADNRDLPAPPYGVTQLYGDLDALRRDHRQAVADADLVVVGSFVPDGREVGRWVLETARGVRAFYDIDTPVTLEKLAAGDHAYLDPTLIPRYDLYLSFTGGPILSLLTERYGAPCARPLYCSVDPAEYRPGAAPPRWDMGYLGTYSADRQPQLERLLLQPAGRRPERGFVVAGPQYPALTPWPDNVTRIEHLAPPQHRAFYTAQRLTLNLTRAAMVRAGYSPSIRLFEAAACGTAIVSDRWEGLDTILSPGEEVLLADDAEDVLGYLSELSDARRRRIGAAARRRILAEHTVAHRAAELERHYHEVRTGAAAPATRRGSC